MKRGTVILVALALLFGGVEQVRAGNVDVTFSYTFMSGQKVSGTVMGDLQADGQTVTNLTNLNAVYSGAPGSTFTFLAPPGTDDLFLSPAAPTFQPSQVFTLYGFVSDPDTTTVQRNFGFAVSNEAGIFNAATVGTFSTIQGEIGYPQNQFLVVGELYNSASWSATAQPIPEPSTFILFGIGLAGMAVYGWRRRKQAAA